MRETVSGDAPNKGGILIINNKCSTCTGEAGYGRGKIYNNQSIEYLGLSENGQWIYSQELSTASETDNQKVNKLLLKQASTQLHQMGYLEQQTKRKPRVSK